MIPAKSLADWVNEHRARRCAPPPGTFTGHFYRYTVSLRSGELDFHFTPKTLKEIRKS